MNYFIITDEYIKLIILIYLISKASDFRIIINLLIAFRMCIQINGKYIEQ